MKRRFRCIESSFFCDFFDFGGRKLLFCAVHTHGRCFAPAGATRGHENRRTSAVAPSTPSRCTLPCFWGDDVESTRGHSLKVRTTQSRERVKGGDFVPFHSPLWGQGAKPLAESRGRASGASPYFSSPLAFMASYCSMEIRQRRGFAPSFAEMMPRCSISSTKRPARAYPSFRRR